MNYTSKVVHGDKAGDMELEPPFEAEKAGLEYLTFSFERAWSRKYQRYEPIKATLKLEFRHNDGLANPGYECEAVLDEATVDAILKAMQGVKQAYVLRQSHSELIR